MANELCNCGKWAWDGNRRYWWCYTQRKELLNEPTYSDGQPVVFLKSMSECTVVKDHCNGTCTVRRVDTGKEMLATYDGLSIN